MGNCCSGDDPSKAKERSEAPIEADDEEEYGPPSTSNTSDPRTPFLVTPDTMALKSEMENNFLVASQAQATASSSSPSNGDGNKALLFNPRLVSLLEFFSHLYVRKKDLFTRVISLHEQELLKVLNKVEQVEESTERPSIQRSRSLTTEKEFNNQRFKVKTFEPDKGQGSNATGGPKPATGGSK